MVKICEKYGAKVGQTLDHIWTKYTHEPTMGKIWYINWSYFGQNMGNIYCWENYGQNMVHKLVIKWAKLDHKINGAKYGKNMVHKLGKIWARFGQNLEQCFVCRFCWCICVYYVMACIMCIGCICGCIGHSNL